ncbi:ferritin-like domain-containing protein [Candidatus Peregrinibacteria bacterium]|nr:ferritin-like domain-containing protein [Candidatus Peregrinibacteria bacterium]
MGTKGLSLVKMNVDELIKLLNKALADEWLAYYQYWVGAKVVQGTMKNSAVEELNEHAADELRHADMLVERITQLGGTPILDPKDWYDLTNCTYEAPTDPAVLKVLEQNVRGEQCAIEVYSKLAEMTKDKDEITHQIVLEILKDEVEHEDDLQALVEDIQAM